MGLGSNHRYSIYNAGLIYNELVSVMQYFYCLMVAILSFKFQVIKNFCGVAAKEADQKDFTLMGEGAKLIMVKRGTINIQLHKSPPGSGSPTPSSTPASSPTNSPSANSPGLRAPFSSPTDDEKAASQPFAKKVQTHAGYTC